MQQTPNLITFEGRMQEAAKGHLVSVGLKWTSTALLCKVVEYRTVTNTGEKQLNFNIIKVMHYLYHTVAALSFVFFLLSEAHQSFKQRVL